MKIGRKTIRIVILVLLALWLSINWFANRIKSQDTFPMVLFTCNGGADEERFLVEEADTILKNGVRRLTSQNGFVIYRIPIGNSEVERIGFCINQVGFHLEFSPDGREWTTLARFSKLRQGNPKKFQPQSSGFMPGLKKAASKTGLAYFRFSGQDKRPDFYLAIKYLTLEISGSTPPEHFQKISAWRNVTGLLPAKLMIWIGLGAIIIFRKLWKKPWRLFGIGALLWIVSVAAKFGFAYLAHNPANRLLHAILPSRLADWTFWLYIGSLTGVFECGIFLLVTKQIRQKQWIWKDASSLGIGFGAVEAIALGIALAFSASLGKGGIVAFSLIGPVERLIALVLHTASVAMIIYAITQRKWGWFVASFFYKSGVDTIAAFLLLSGTDLLEIHPWFAQFCLFAPFALAGIAILLVLRQIWNQDNPKVST